MHNTEDRHYAQCNIAYHTHLHGCHFYCFIKLNRIQKLNKMRTLYLSLNKMISMIT